MERRTLVALLLSGAIFFGWQKFYVEPHMAKTAQPTVQNVPPLSAPIAPGTPAATLSGNTPATPSAPVSRHAPETRTLISDSSDAILSDGNRAFVGWNLKSYKLGIQPEAAAVNLESVTHQDGQLAFAFDDPAYKNLTNIQGEFKPAGQGFVWDASDANVTLHREIQPVAGQPYYDLTFTADFKGKRPNYLFLSLASSSPHDDPEEHDRQLLYWTDKSLERVIVSKLDAQKDILTSVKYVAASNRYFLMAIVPQGPLEAKGQLQPTGPRQGRLSLIYPITGNSITVPMRVYFGPKELELLRKVDPALDNTVDLGWFQVVAYPLLKLLKFFYSFLGNYGVAIIVLTVMIKLVTFPLNYKSMKSMKDMARLQPQLQKLREKYKDDKEALNREMLTLMRTHGYNPAAGCLPMLVQMPIFFALYKVLYGSIELFHAPFAGWIHDLSLRDPLYVTPVLLTGTMWLQQKLSPQTATDPTQQKMMQFMPLIFGFMMMNLASGLTIYMLTNALASILQQMIINKKLDVKGAPVVVVST
jgi:YidC/Oxa1 family membrane protein insertase